jgi:hypothetical protein
MNLALQVRWLWLSQVEASRPGKEFDIQVPLTVSEIFKAATSSVVGDGATTFFWLDSWLPDGRLKNLAPHLFALTPKRLSRLRLVRDTLDGGWLDDIHPDLDAPAMEELLVVADHVVGLTVTERVADEFRWNWGANGTYSSKYCYILACFVGAWPWQERYRSGSVGSFSGLCCVIGAGLQTDWSDMDCRRP